MQPLEAVVEALEPANALLHREPRLRGFLDRQLNDPANRERLASALAIVGELRSTLAPKRPTS